MEKQKGGRNQWGALGPDNINGIPYFGNKPNRGQRACFKHQKAQHICHCMSPNQVDVNFRIRLPKQGDNKGWADLRIFIAEQTKLNNL